MKRLKKNQLGPWCTFCQPNTSRALFVGRGWSGEFACDDHKKDLVESESKEEHLTEADYQTWVRL